MKKFSIPVICLLTGLAVGLLYAEGEVDQYIKVRHFSDGQKAQYNNHVLEIASMQRKIESYYDYLERRKNNDCLMFHGGERIYCHYYSINEKNITYVPLQATPESVYGQRQRYMYNELAYFEWGADKRVKTFYFETRRGYLGTTRRMSRMIYGNSISDFDGKTIDSKRPPMNIVINEILPTGKGRFARYSFPTEEKIFDQPPEDINIGGRKMRLKTIFLREPEDRLKVVRKYVKLLKRLEMRLQWNVHSGNVRRSAELERILRDSY